MLLVVNLLQLINKRISTNVTYLTLYKIILIFKVVHRNLKPSKILCSTDSISPDTIKICDFRFAKHFCTKNGYLMTPSYTAKCAIPEEIRKQSYATASDIWSLGILLYTLLAG